MAWLLVRKKIEREHNVRFTNTKMHLVLNVTKYRWEKYAAQLQYRTYIHITSIGTCDKSSGPNA